MLLSLWFPYCTAVTNLHRCLSLQVRRDLKFSSAGRRLPANSFDGTGGRGKRNCRRASTRRGDAVGFATLTLHLNRASLLHPCIQISDARRQMIVQQSPYSRRKRHCWHHSSQATAVVQLLSQRVLTASFHTKFLSHCQQRGPAPKVSKLGFHPARSFAGQFSLWHVQSVRTVNTAASRSFAFLAAAHKRSEQGQLAVMPD